MCIRTFISLQKLERQYSYHPLIYGINGPQGCGKTTLAAELVSAFSSLGKNAVSLSIDDFYLTHSEQLALAQRYPNDSLLQQRGYPGTHDVQLGTRILQGLRNLGAGEILACPVYDKSLFQGQGDRLPEAKWKKVKGPVDVIFFEGWMLGFSEVAESELPSQELKGVNRFLGEYVEWTRLLDAFIQLMPREIEFVVNWRIEAEEKMKAQGRSGMSSDEIRRYIEKFLPAYRLYLPRLAIQPPVSKNYMRLLLDEHRIPFALDKGPGFVT